MSSENKTISTGETSESDLPTPSPEELKTPLGLVPEKDAPSRKKKALTLLAALLVLALVIGLSVGLTSNMGKDEEGAEKNLNVGDALNGTSNSTDDDEDYGSDSNIDWCGDGHIGDGICKKGFCCSYFGYCGFEPEYCVNGQTVAPEVMRTDRFCGDGFPGNGTCANSTLCCSSGKCEYTYYACGYWPDGRDAPPPCGNGYVGDGICEIEGECCSKWGYCGVTDDHCNNPPGSRRLRATNTTPILEN